MSESEGKMAASSPGWSITATSESSLIVEFGTVIDEKLNRAVHRAARRLEALRPRWEIELVVAWTTLSVSMIPHRMPPQERSFAALRQAVEDALHAMPPEDDGGEARIVDIPVCYGGDHGVDLEDVAKTLGITPEDVVRLHSEPVQLIFMLGFAPGQPVIGLTDETLSLPRRPTPRVEVPARSVAIANRQTVIYSLPVPGGWHLIGRTPQSPFRIGRDPLCLWQPGDRVRFRPISAEEYADLEAQE